MVYTSKQYCIKDRNGNGRYILLASRKKKANAKDRILSEINIARDTKVDAFSYLPAVFPLQ